jgi:dihydroorotate dehydrogenase (NAD+) catalytic subunit
MLKPAFYDPTISYEDNYEKGPPINFLNLTPPQRKITKKYHHLGFEVNTPFGIPPGPLLNSKFIKAAFEWGFDVSTYKTVRAETFPCHPFPNVLKVDIDGQLHPDKNPRLVASTTPIEQADPEHLSITNSFGVPSKEPSTWQDDVKKALTYTSDGQLLILSFMGTVKENQTQDEFIKDFTQAAILSKETGAKVVEANLSCPNIGNEGLVCYNLDVTEKVCESIRSAIGDLPFIIKVGYYSNDQQLEQLAKIANKYSNAIAAINTLQAEIVDKNGNQALPGKNRLKSGVCGAGIKWAGLEMVKKLKEIKERNKYSYEIVGIGGVMTANDYMEYRETGADTVQSATGAMWNPYLAYEIWKMEQGK